jgi:hypothetical protein
MTVGKLLRSMDYSLQANSKTKEGGQHVDRDAQFQYIDEQSRAFLKACQPVISCDTNYARNTIMHGFAATVVANAGQPRGSLTAQCAPDRA